VRNRLDSCRLPPDPAAFPSFDAALWRRPCLLDARQPNAEIGQIRRLRVGHGPAFDLGALPRRHRVQHGLFAIRCRYGLADQSETPRSMPSCRSLPDLACHACHYRGAPRPCGYRRSCLRRQHFRSFGPLPRFRRYLHRHRWLADHRQDRRQRSLPPLLPPIRVRAQSARVISAYNSTLPLVMPASTAGPDCREPARCCITKR
jgi:hypothetical protein